MAGKRMWKEGIEPFRKIRDEIRDWIAENF
jgi:hypothetical protein